MSCILKITDPILKPLLDGAGLKSSYSNIDELREAFEGVADKAFVIPLTIRSEGFNRRKFGKVYKDEGIKLQIVMPGQEFFSQFTIGDIPLEEFGTTDQKGITLTFDSIDTFLGFYLANYLYVTPENLLTQGNRKGLVDSIGDILKNTLDRIKGTRHPHSRSIEDLKFADALYNYVNLLYSYANLAVPQTITDLYSEIEKKWNQFHTEKKERVNEQARAEENIQKIKQEEKLQEPNPNANLFFESYDTYPKGNPNEYQVIDKPLSQARRKFLEYLKSNEQDYAIRLMQGATSFPTQTNDQGEYPTKQVIERGVVGIVVLRDDPSKAVYLGKDGLTTEIEQATYIPYEVEGNEMKSPYIPFYFSNTGEHGKLKEEFRKGGEFVFNILNVKEELFKEEGSIGSLGIRVEDIKINSLKGEQYAGVAYIEKGGRQIFVDRTTLSPEEIDEVVKLLEGTYEEADLIKVVEYLNDLLSVSQEEVSKGSDGGEIQFFPAVDKVMILPKRIKTEEGYQSVQSSPVYIDEDRELVLKSLNAARVRFGRTEEGKLRLGWTKYKMIDGVLNELVVKGKDAVKFYEDHSKVTLIKGSSLKIASFNQRQIQDVPVYQVGLARIKPDTSLNLGEVNQLIMQPLTKTDPLDKPGIVKEKQDQLKLWTALFQLADVSPQFIFTEEDPLNLFKNQDNPAYYNPKDGNIYIRLSWLKEPSFLRSVLVEELAHAITVPKIRGNKETKEYKQLEEDYKKAKQLLKTYKTNEEYLKLTDQQKTDLDRIANYHLQSMEEFVAGISVPYFRAFLRLGESSFFDKVKENIKALLDLILKGLNPSLYTDVTTHVFDFITSKEEIGGKSIEEQLTEKIWKDIVDSGKYKTIDDNDVERPVQYSDNPKEIFIVRETGEESFEDLYEEKLKEILYSKDKIYTEVKSIQDLIQGSIEEVPEERLRRIVYLKRLNKYLSGKLSNIISDIKVDSKHKEKIFNEVEVNEIFNYQNLPGTQGAEKVYSIQLKNEQLGYAVIDNGNQIRWITIEEQYEGMGLATKLINEIRKSNPNTVFKITLINNPQIFKIVERLGGKQLTNTTAELPSYNIKKITLSFYEKEVPSSQQRALFQQEQVETKKEFKFKPKKEDDLFYASAPLTDEVDLQVIKAIDAEIGQYLFQAGQFGDKVVVPFGEFVQGNVKTQALWNRVYNSLGEQLESSEGERARWIEYFLSNEDRLFKAWQEKSFLFKFDSGEVFINEGDEIDEQENPEEEQSKDPGFNRVDSEQSKTRMELADKYAKVLVRLTPVGYEKGMVKLADFTNLWNRLQTELKNTLSFDEQYFKLSNQELQNRFPEIKTIYDRLTTLKENITNNNLIVINSFQVSFSTAELPVYVPLFTQTDKGLKYNFFPQPRLDVQHLTFEINRMFREWAEPFEIDEEFPTYDNNKILNKLLSIKVNGVARPNDILNLLKGFLPIPEYESFLTDSNLIEFYNQLVSLFRQRGNNVHILNGQFVDFIRNKQYWENPGGGLGESAGISTQFNQLLSALSKYSALSVSNMTTNAEGQNQSILLSWSSWLIGIKELNQGISYRIKNPIFKYSLIANNIDATNQLQPVNLSGSRYKEEERYEGSVSMNLDYIPYLRQQFSTFSLDGIIEISRAETKQSSFGYKFNWQDGKHPIKFEKFKSNIWSQDASQIYISNNQVENAKGYLRGELERLKLERESPNIYYPKYNNIKNEFHLFSYFSQGLKDKLVAEEPAEAIKNNRKEIEKELNQHFNNEIETLKENIFNQSGIPFDKNHPSLNVIDLQKMIFEMGFDNWLRAFVINQEIYQIENFITGHGDIGQHDKPYKRFGSNISTGVPVVVNEETQIYLENTVYKQFSERIPAGNSFVLKSDIYQFPTEQLERDNETSLRLYYDKIGLKKSDEEIKKEAKENATPYSKTDVSDGQGAMTPDFGRMLMMVTGNWSKEREEGFWFLKLQHKKNKGFKLTDDEIDHYNKVNKKVEKEGVYWFFPVLKMQVRGEAIPLKGETNVAIELLDKFSLAWLWPDELEGKNFGVILDNMFNQGYDYMKYETGTKIGTFIPDNLVEQIKEGKIELTIDSGHSIDLKYMKEQVKASDHFKDSGPMSTQARKLVLSNLKFNGEYLNDNIKEAVRGWKESQSDLSRFNRERLLEEISTDGLIDNKKLAELVSKEVKRRDLPESVSAIFDNYGELDYERFEQSVSPQLVETLIYSLLRKRIVRPQFPGEQYIQVSSAIYDGNERDLDFYKIEDGITISDKIIFGHSGIGKSFLKEKGLDFISLDDDYKKEINDFIDSKRGSQSRQEFKATNKKEYHEFLKDLWKIAKERAKKENKKLFVSNLPILRMFPNDFNKFITMSKETFIQRSKDRNDYKEGYTEEWKESIDKLLSEVDQSKILKTTKYLSELLSQQTKPAQCKIVLSGEFLKLLNLPEINNHLKKKEIKAVYDQLSSYEQLEYKRYILNELLLIPEFVDKHKRELTVFSSRIPGQGYNSMNIQIVKEFLPTYMGPIIVANPLITTQSGTDFDYDKLPTITPKLNKEGKASNDPNNRMLEAVSSILLDPINFHRLTTPNHTKDIDVVVNNVLEKLGISVTEPIRDSIFSFSTHLSKWWAMKMKDPLGIGATNNTFYTLIQDSDSKLNPRFQLVDGLWVDTKFPFERDDRGMNYPLTKSGKDKLNYVNQFINITVDVASKDAIGYTGLRKDNSGLLLFLLENGVSFEDAFYFINQPIIFKYHQLLSKYLDQGESITDAKNQVITQLLGIQTEEEINGRTKKISRDVIYQQIYALINTEKFTNLLDTVGTKPDTQKQKQILAYYLVGLEMSNKMRDAQSYNNFDTTTAPNVLYSQARENLKDDVKDTGLFDIKGIEQIHNDSVISHLNVHDLFKEIAENAFPIKRDPLFMEEALRLGELIYNPVDKAKFFTKFDNDYLLAILQNYGSINKEKIEENLKGDLAKGWKKIKDKVKDLTISKYITENHSSKVNMVSLSLFLGLDNDSETLNQISRDVRTLLKRPDTKEWAEQFVETALYSTLFSQSPVYYLKALPHEIVAKYLKEAYDKYQPTEQFIQAFSNKFIYERGYQFSQYFLPLYKADGIKNLSRDVKVALFNPEAWRYTDYKLSLEELKQPEMIKEQSTEFTKGSKGIGEEISSYKDDLAYALTNPVFTSPTGSTWSRTWSLKQQEWRNYLSAGITFEGKSYRDVEEAYQKNKSKYPIGQARDKFMLNLIEIKLRTYPKLVEEINKKGGINYLTDSTHQPTNKNSHWETGGNNAFIKLLSQAYLNVTDQQNQLIQQPVQPKQLDLFDQQEDFTKPCNDAPF